MLEFLTANAGTILVSVVLAIILICIVVKMRRDKKKGGGCTCGCAGCPSQGVCQAYKSDDKSL